MPKTNPAITDHDIYLFKEGSHFKLYEKLGAHPFVSDGGEGTQFAVWAPNARSVSVVGEFNEWKGSSHPMHMRQDGSGIWEKFIPGVKKWDTYKYNIESNYNNYRVNKTDPYAYYCECPPKTASIVWDLEYEWHDSKWMKRRHKYNSLTAPYSIYEVHLGSWRRVPEENNRYLTYRELAHDLADYAMEMGFTHIELLPIMEHPFYASWGYQTTGYFAPTARYGTPQDFMYFVDYLHQHGIGVILDWTPSHFSKDEHGLVYFDGTHLYEHDDPRKGFHPDWQSYIFNYGRNEVKEFLISTALFWLDKYHIDALRVDAVASLLYLDYSRKDGQWIPNKYGGKENLEALEFIRRFNQAVYKEFPDTQTIAEESTAWPMVSKPTDSGGLGFGMKWNMGWMHDTLQYMCHDPLYRKFHHNELTFSMIYAFHENFILSLSHDEVVHGKGSLLGKMPGDEWQKFANLRLLLGYMYGYPGKKLFFMGAEFAQSREWGHDSSIDWHLLARPLNNGVHAWMRDLTHFYKDEGILYKTDFEGTAFEWIDFHDWENSIISFIRKGKKPRDVILIACNFTPVPKQNYRLGVPHDGMWKEVLNSDWHNYGGSGQANIAPIEAVAVPLHDRPYSLELTLPPLGIVFLKCQPVLKEDGPKQDEDARAPVDPRA